MPWKERSRSAGPPGSIRTGLPRDLAPLGIQQGDRSQRAGGGTDADGRVGQDIGGQIRRGHGEHRRHVAWLMGSAGTGRRPEPSVVGPAEPVATALAGTQQDAERHQCDSENLALK